MRREYKPQDNRIKHKALHKFNTADLAYSAIFLETAPPENGGHCIATMAKRNTGPTSKLSLSFNRSLHAENVEGSEYSELTVRLVGIGD